MRIVLIAAMTVLALLPARLDSQAANPMVGAWRVVEIVPPGSPAISSPQPTMYVFTARHYSHVSVTSPAPRPNYAGPNVTEKQLLEMWEPFTATAGTYEVNGNELTIRPIVAKNPGFMTPGSFTTFRFERAGADVWIRAVRGPAGPIPEAAANRVRLARME